MVRGGESGTPQSGMGGHMWVSAQILDAKTDTAAGAHTYSSENNRPEEEEEAGVFLLSTRRRKARRVL